MPTPSTPTAQSLPHSLKALTNAAPVNTLVSAKIRPAGDAQTINYHKSAGPDLVRDMLLGLRNVSQPQAASDTPKLSPARI